MMILGKSLFSMLIPMLAILAILVIGGILFVVCYCLLRKKPNKKHCHSCGTELRPDALFCPHCGAKQL